MVPSQPAIALDSLPLPALEAIVSCVVSVDPSLTIPFLSSMGSVLHQATSRVLYNRLRIVLPALVEGVEGRGEGETKKEHYERRRWQVVLGNPTRYASSVKEISVFPPANPHAASHGSIAQTPVNKGEQDIFLALLNLCATTVTRIEWHGVGVWGEQVSQQLLSLPSLSHLSLLPPPLHPSSLSTQYHPSLIPRFHLPHPLPQALRTLDISRLSPMGAKNFASHITNLPGHSPLDKVSVDSALFDDQLAENLSEAGRGVKELWIRTTGTKLTDVGLLKLFEGCQDLERLTLSEVQGRFSKSIWTKIDFPETFKHLRVEISDVGPHHSWSLDHLLSIPSVQLSNLQTLSITRSTPPFSLFPVPPLGHEPPPPDDVCAVKPIPEILFDALLEDGTGLRVLEIDWWEVSSDQVSKLAKTLTNLEKFKFELDAPFSKLLLLTTPFSSLTRLHTLHVIIQTQHLPLPSAAPTSSSIPPHTPSSSPTISKSSLRSERSSEHQHAVPSDATGNPSPPISLSDLQSDPGEELHPVLFAKSTDPTIPLLRDVRKFVRRVPRLVELGWVGRGGIGLWLTSRDTEQPSSLSESTGASSTIGRGRRSSSGGGAIVAAAGLKGVVDIEFVCFAVKWKDDWAEAAKGFPAWNFEGGAGGGGMRSPTREMREFGGGGGGVGTSPRSSFSTGGGQPSLDRDRYGGHERQGSIGSTSGTSEKRRGMSMSSVTSSIDGTSPSSVLEGGTLRLDLGRVDPPSEQESTSTPRRRSITEERDASISGSAAVGGSNIVQPRIPAKFLPPPSQQPPTNRRTLSSASALPTVTSSAELERLGLEEQQPTATSSSSSSNQTTAPALLSYRDRAARIHNTSPISSNSDPADQPSTGNGNGGGKKGSRSSNKIIIPLGGHLNPTPAQAQAQSQASTSPPVSTRSIGGGAHSRRASEPAASVGKIEGTGGGGGKKVVSSNGWKTTGQAQGGGKKAGGTGGGKKK